MRFRYTDYRRAGASRKKTMTLTATEFIRRMLLHVLPPGYPQRLGAPDPEPAGLRGTNPRLAARYWGLSVPDYIERVDVWRLDPPNGNLLPWILIESPLGVANVREIARQLSERNIGAVLFAGSETGGDMLNTHGGSLSPDRTTT